MTLARRSALFLPLLAALLMPGPGATIATGLVVLSLCIVPDARKAVFARGPWLRSLGIGAAGGIAIALLIGLLLDQLLAALFGQPPDLSVFDNVRGNVPAYLRLLALGVLYAPIAEELVFRGFVIGWGSALFGPRAGLPLALLSAAIFGISHVYQGWTGIATTALIGLGYGLVYLAAGRHLPAAIAAHMTVNAIGITLLYLGI